MDTIFIQIHITGQEKIFLLIWIRDYKWQPLMARLWTRETESSITQIACSLAKGKLGKNTTVLQGTKGCRLKHKFWQQWTIVSVLSILSYLPPFNVSKGSLYSFTRDNERPNLCDLKAYARLGVIWVGSKSRNAPKDFGLCTHPDVRDYRGNIHVCMRLSGKMPRISFF